MQALRIQSEQTTRRGGALGAEAPLLGRRVLAAARVAAAMHMGEVAQIVRTGKPPSTRSLEQSEETSAYSQIVQARTGETPVPPTSERSGGAP